MVLALGDGWEAAPAAGVRHRIATALVPGAPVAGRLGRIELLPHQREAVGLLRAALARHRGVLLADPVGTGKTYVALAVAAAYSRALVVAPAALRPMWRHAIEVTATAPALVSLESLSGARPLPTLHRGLVVVDEAHHARNPATRRYDALARLAWGNDLLLLTATPVHNRVRDLHALCALFLGEHAERIPGDLLARVLCRRLDAAPRERLPRLAAPQWIEGGGDPQVLADILALPPPLPPRDGTAANALGTLGLVRQWCSSDAALDAALGRRLTTALAMEARLEQGNLPTRRELREWIAGTGVVQPALSLDGRGDGVVSDAAGALARLHAHTTAVRALRCRVSQRSPPDAPRLGRIRAVLDAHRSSRVVMFTHSLDTAVAFFRALAPAYRCAMLGGSTTRIASGRASREEIVRRFAPPAPCPAPPGSATMRVDVLIATDVLSEGVDLHDAGVLVHLDLPWTLARLEQRVGRLRRLGATHDEILQYVVRPLPVTERTTGVLRRLAMKAGITRRRLGLDPFGFTLPSARPPRARGAGESVPEAADRLRRLTSGWRTPGHAGPGDGDRCLVAASTSRRGTHAFLAVIVEETGERVVAGCGAMMSAEPADVADVAAACCGDDIPVPATHARLALARLSAWLDAERARSAILGDGWSPAHRRVLRRLAGARRGLGRRGQRAVVEELARLRSVLARSAGAGAERFLDAWLAGRADHAITLDDATELRQVLEPRARAGSGPAAPPRVRAVLLLVPRG